MAWERRKRGGLYYTRSRKVGGRVIREYVGGGLTGHLAAQMDDNERMDRKSRAEKMRAELSHFEAIDTQVALLFDFAEALAQGSLMLAGYHRHHRGEWRKCREYT